MNIATVLAASFGAAALLARVAVAQPVTSPGQVQGVEPNTMSVEILDPDNMIDRDQARAAIGSELGIRVVDATSFAPALGRMEIAIDQGVLRIAYHPAAGTVIERTMALPPRLEDRMALIAFVATNLVRDQASEVIAALPDLPPPTNESTPPVITRDNHDPLRTMPFSIGLVYPLSLDRIRGERVQVGVGIYGVAGYADSSTVASISGVADVKRNGVSGAQIAGVATVAGEVDGVQIAGVASYTHRDVDGFQISGVASASKGRVNGGQIAGVVNAAMGVDGVQIGGVANVASTVDGLQLAGVVNVAGDVRGAQIGVINVARKVSGLQLGVVNLTDDGDDAIPIGVFTYSRNGRLALDAQVDSSRVSSVAFRHGSKHMHNVWSVGWSPDHDHVLVGAGLGVHGSLTDNITVDIEAMQWLTNVWNADLGQISQLRAMVAVPVASNVELFGGVAGNVYLSDKMDDSENFHPTNEWRHTSDGNNTLVIWPSAFAGVRLRAR